MNHSWIKVQKSNNGDSFILIYKLIYIILITLIFYRVNMSNYMKKDDSDVVRVAIEINFEVLNKREDDRRKGGHR